MSTLLAFWFGLWGVHYHLTYGNTGYLVMGIISLVLGVVLIIYGVWFFGKIKRGGFS
ncbi:MAG: hypothetical protein ACRD1R_19920 [Acidobacteriota bacterium]